ncbi:MAG TPA: glycosyltransferase family 39 protein [Dehalococcoidia bacterium]|nr:glycosyltransferase family 39 protein [Dehalococcoidia bacterium]
MKQSPSRARRSRSPGHAGSDRRRAERPVPAARRLLVRLAQWPWLLLLPILAVAGWLRLTQLDVWPLFVDEDAYTYMAIRLAELPFPESLGLYDEFRGPGYPKPSLALLLQNALTPAAGDPVVAGRALSGLFGVVTTGLCYPLAHRLGGPAAGLLTAALYAVAPVAVLHERMVLQDGPMTALALAAVLLGWRAVDWRSIPLGLAAGLAGLIAVQFKVPGIGVAGAIAGWLVAHYRHDRAGRLTPAILAAGGAILSYLLLIASPLGRGLLDQNRDLLQPVIHLWPNLQALADSAWTYFPWALLLLILAGGVLLWRADRRLAIGWLIALGVWIVPWLVLSRFAPSRYYLPAVPYALALAAFALVWCWSWAGVYVPVARGAVAAGAVLLLWPSGQDAYRLITQHQSARLSTLDDWQYRSGWPSGYGYREAMALVRSVPPGSAVAFSVNPSRRIAIDFHRGLPPGVTNLGLIELGDPLPPNPNGPTFLVVDDGGDPEGSRLSQATTAYPDLVVVGRFSRPELGSGISVLHRAG